MIKPYFALLLFIIRITCKICQFRVAAMTSSPASTSLTSEGSLIDMQIAPTQASKPGSTPGFYNRKRRIGRDFVVLNVARWLANEALRLPAGASDSAEEGPSYNDVRPARLLDATCATGIQGLRAAMESPLLARAIISKQHKTNNDKMPMFPELHVTLNDLDDDAADLATQNMKSLQVDKTHEQEQKMSLTVTRRVAQALMHEETFEVSVLDPFGSVQPLLDAALARAPQRGLIEVCATDVGVLYGTRPKIAQRHYGARLAHKRPPCYRERGVRLLFASIAQAAGRHDRGVEPVYGISTEHFCLASMKVTRGAKAADATAKQVQRVRICRKCGAAAVSGVDESSIACQCGCEAMDGAGTDAQEEGPMWIGPLYDVDAIREMVNIADLEEAKDFISKETRSLLNKVQNEAAVNSMFHRRPGVAAGRRIPKLTKLMEVLERRGFDASRTHFCIKSLKTNASPTEFDNAVKAISSCD